MSRTIVTNSKSEFFTNINSEQLLGTLCKMVGAKYEENKFSGGPVLAYSMTKEEAVKTSLLLNDLIGKEPEIFPELRNHFSENSDYKALNLFIIYYSFRFYCSDGYECIS